MRYSIFSLARNALAYHEGWGRAWRSPDPQPNYEAVVVGGGGHGLATAYYLARNHGIRSVAVLEKGSIGLGNTGRNTTIIRSNYLQDASAGVYKLSHELYETLSQELNFNVMFSPRGVLTLCQTEHDLRGMTRIEHANRVHGIDSRMVDVGEIRRLCPPLNVSRQARFPILGGLWQARGGTARHDAVAWGYARAADRLGVDIIQNCEVTGFEIEHGRVRGLRTTRGTIGCSRVGLVVAGHSTQLASLAGFRLPIESVTLQAYVSEPVKPCLDIVVMASTVHGYVSQSDKGELVLAGGTDSYLSYSRRGSFHHVRESATALVELFPMISRLRLMRQWGGTVDMTADRSPIIGPSPVDGIFLNCGWGTGGFKSIPGSGHCFASTIARSAPDSVAGPFGLERFREGRPIDESVAAGVAH